MALDHNFPQSILETLSRYMPEVDLVPVARIDSELAELEDHDLIYELAVRRWTILVTGNYKMLNDAAVLVALHPSGIGGVRVAITTGPISIQQAQDGHPA